MTHSHIFLLGLIIAVSWISGYIVGCWEEVTTFWEPFVAILMLVVWVAAAGCTFYGLVNLVAAGF